MNITFVEAIQRFYQNYTNFSGRATRAEFWYVVLYTFVAGAVLGMISDWLAYIFSLINIIPNIAISIRRMHDISKSGWWILIALVPLIGWIWYIVLAATPSKGDNQWGPGTACATVPPARN